ncbi:hypothetical protein A1351_23460 [Methylosinus sp. R-45379]|uniref:hypothetical protein n=1 Tax=Methylosinus sp. R-45379 TaxID=980563 RepID=UPI0007C897B4|nr:hypothetical protein [Methylosinus sp. R-45379]OAI28791.1 hypothetical protein A1351_23460 [Methylosinus sp. R-45379]
MTDAVLVVLKSSRAAIYAEAQKVAKAKSAAPESYVEKNCADVVRMVQNRLAECPSDLLAGFDAAASKWLLENTFGDNPRVVAAHMAMHVVRLAHAAREAESATKN